MVWTRAIIWPFSQEIKTEVMSLIRHVTRTWSLIKLITLFNKKRACCWKTTENTLVFCIHTICALRALYLPFPRNGKSHDRERSNPAALLRKRGHSCAVCERFIWVFNLHNAGSWSYRAKRLAFITNTLHLSVVG